MWWFPQLKFQHCLNHVKTMPPPAGMHSPLLTPSITFSPFFFPFIPLIDFTFSLFLETISWVVNCWSIIYLGCSSEWVFCIFWLPSSGPLDICSCWIVPLKSRSLKKKVNRVANLFNNPTKLDEKKGGVRVPESPNCCKGNSFVACFQNTRVKSFQLRYMSNYFEVLPKRREG